jgi:hypothetical protein
MVTAVDAAAVPDAGYATVPDQRSWQGRRDDARNR